MPIKNLTLGACMLLACASSASNKIYTVRKGDTLSDIASKFGVRKNSILEANNLGSHRKIRAGLKLKIPTGSHASGKPQHAGAGVLYTVRPGDSDWGIAKKFSITEGRLRELNSGVDFHALQIGTKLHVPGSAGAESWRSDSSEKAASGSSYSVQEGDNDWTIAKKVGTTPATLHKLNPDVRWNAVQIGQKISIPGHAIALKMPVIHTKMAVVAKDAALLRAGANMGSKKLCTLGKGDEVKVLGHRQSWYKVRTDGGAGWMRADNLLDSVTQKVVADMSRRPKKTKLVAHHKSKAAKKHSGAVARVQATKDTLLASARSFRGVRYSWGGMSRSGTDCSGFTSQVFRSIGISLPRTSTSQASVGRHISRGDLQAGDLVFFRTQRSVRINHVGIYIGNGKFIHASSGGGEVMISALGEGYYNSRFATARRVAKLSSAEVQTIVHQRGAVVDPDSPALDGADNGDPNN